MGDNCYIFGWKNDELVVYVRILKSDDDFELVVIGWVIVSEVLCGEKVGQQLMSKIFEICMYYWFDKFVYFGVQVYL